MSTHEMMGVQFDRSYISRIVHEIDRQKKAKRDYVYPLSKLGYSDAGELMFAGHDKGFRVHDRNFVEWASAEEYLDHQRSVGAEGADDWKIEVVEGSPAIRLNDTARQQLLGRLNVPGKFINYLEGKEYRDIAGNILRELLARDDRRALVRTIDGNARAVLSDKYRILDNSDLFFCAFDQFKSDAELWQARLWDDGFELFGVAKHISGEVTVDRTFDPGDGWKSRWYGKSGDVHNAAVRVRNSETGEGGLSVKLAIMRRVCFNFNVYADGVSQIHAGRTLAVDEGLLVSEATRELESQVIWSKVKDAITTAFDAERFGELMEKLNAATANVIPGKIEAVTSAVDNVVKAYEISDAAKSLILAELMGSGDFSQFGLVQAVTATAHKQQGGAASRLEEVGGQLASVSSSKFQTLLATAS